MEDIVQEEDLNLINAEHFDNEDTQEEPPPLLNPDDWSSRWYGTIAYEDGTAPIASENGAWSRFFEDPTIIGENVARFIKVKA